MGEIKINKLSTTQFLILLAAIVVIGAGIIWGVTSTKNSTVAKVGGEKITENDLYEAMKDKLGRIELEMLIEQKVLELELKKTKNTISDADIEKELDEYREAFGGEEGLTYSLAQQGMTMEDLSANIKKMITLSFVYGDTIDVTDEEAQEYFNENKARFDQAPQVASSIILVEDKKVAEDLLEQIANDADFTALAKEHSIHSSAESGGSIGYLAAEQLPEELSKPVFALKKDEISDLIKTEAGYHIVKVTDTKPAEAADFTVNKAEVVELLKSQKMQAAYPEWYEEKVAEYKVDNKLKK